MTPDHSPREFFISRIAEGAAEEGRPLTDQELSYLEWGRIEDEAEQERLLERVQGDYGETGFEDRMTDLLRQAYRKDAAADPDSPRRYREHYERLDGAGKDLELSLIAAPVLSPKPAAINSFTMAVVGAVGIVFTVLMIILIIRYLFWK